MGLRPVGLALLALVVGACGSVTPSLAPPSPSTPSPATPAATTPAAPTSTEPSPAATDLVEDIDIGGRTMHLVCRGHANPGEPTIVLEAGLEEDSRTWDAIVGPMQSDHRLCAYDRAGVGQSEPPVERSVTATDHARDLRALLDAAGVVGPYVLVSQSYGAAVAIVFTHANPDDVAGLLFVDPRTPWTSARFRAVLPKPAKDEPDGLVQLRFSLDSFETDPLLNHENLSLGRSYEEAAAALDGAAPAFGDRPVVVLSAGISLGAELGLPPDLAKKTDEIWAEDHRELAGESTNGSVETVPGAGHMIQIDRPQAVIEALEGILGDLATP